MKSVIAGAVIAATLAVAVPVSAQVVCDRDDVIIRDHEHRWNRHRGWYRDYAECRTVRVRTQLPNGKTVLKTRRSC